MNEPSWLWVVGLAVVLLLVGFTMGSRRREGRDLMAPPPPVQRSPPLRHSATPAPFLVIQPDVRTRIDAALKAGNKIEAIKLMREATGMGLAEAKAAVEAMAKS
jgi:large subunit ribosomal protein L7/L12